MSIPLNTLSLIALCTEYCAAVENVSSQERQDFVDTMLKLLPRIYISVTDVPGDGEDLSPMASISFLNPVLKEDYYDTVRGSMQSLFGEEDDYLEVFEEDMKYSDTPITASISEGLADIFQALYNFVYNVRDVTDEQTAICVNLLKDDFAQWWSATLCNTLRALNHIKYAR